MSKHFGKQIAKIVYKHAKIKKMSFMSTQERYSMPHTSRHILTIVPQSGMDAPIHSSRDSPHSNNWP